MSGLIDAILIGAGLSVVAGTLALVLARVLESRVRGAETVLWRGARVVAVLPVLVAPLVYAIPEAAPALPALDFGTDAAAVEGVVAPLADLPILSSAPALPALRDVALAIYGIGLLACLGLALRRHWQRAAVIAASRPARPDETLLLARQAELIGGPTPELRVHGGTTSPFLTGWRGVVLMPEHLFENRQMAGHALAHELCHWRRGDERDRLVGAALLVVAWFHWPLRQIERHLEAARELACDRDCLAALGPDARKGYAVTLIESFSLGLPPATAFGPLSRRHREMRIQAILAGAPANTLSARLVAAGVLAAVIPVGLAQAMVTDRRDAAAVQVEQVPARSFSDATGEAVLQAQQLQDEAQWQASIDRLDAALAEQALSPYEQSIALQMRGRAYYELDDIEAAVADWRSAIATGGNTAEEERRLRINIGQLLIVSGDAEGGVAELEAAYAGVEPDARIARALAQAYAQAGQFDRGLAHARAAYQADPQDRSAWTLQLYYLQELGLAAEMAAHRAAEPSASPSADGEKSSNRSAPRRPDPAPAAPADPGPAPAAPAALSPAPDFSHAVAPAARISSRYGERPARPAGAPRDHGGYDLAAPEGTPVMAPAAGVVTQAQAGFGGRDSWGNTLVLDHGGGWQTVYAHLQGFDVQVGDTVSAGQAVARVGSTGQVTGPHVHVEVRLNGHRQDPADHLPGLR
ncbi:peptidoglycan DD-metalloendopeptidase family protein [Maricaulis sp. CAU 1757]